MEKVTALYIYYVHCMKIREQARPDYGQWPNGGFTQRTGGRGSVLDDEYCIYIYLYRDIVVLEEERKKKEICT